MRAEILVGTRETDSALLLWPKAGERARISSSFMGSERREDVRLCPGRFLERGQKREKCRLENVHRIEPSAA